MTPLHKRILVIDNHDSFTYNLVDCFRQLGCTVVVYRNTVAPAFLDTLDFDLLVLSPGPAVPRQAGNLLAIIDHCHQRTPILGICLGHQALVEYFGGSIHNIAPKHGVSDTVVHDGRTLFTGLPATVRLARYHSWAAQAVPDCMEVSARAHDGTVMAIRHKSLPIEGLQFHPESILSMADAVGMRILRHAVQGQLAGSTQHYAQLMQQLQTAPTLHPDTGAAICACLQHEHLSDDQKLVLLTALSFKLEDANSLAAFVRLLQGLSPFAALAHLGAQGVDVCSTGGSGLPRINTSTLSALLLSGMGLPILKHGNRAASGRFGSHDLLAALQVPQATGREAIAQTFHDTGLAFLFAPHMHPVLASLAATRVRMGIPTVFNIMGPLLNPANPSRQFIGTAAARYMPLLMQAAIKLGKRQVYVVRGNDGLDEITLTGSTRVLAYVEGEQAEYSVAPADFGLPTHTLAAITAPTAEVALRVAEGIIAGEADSAHAHLIAANAAFCLRAFHDPSLTLAQATVLARDAMRSGVLAQQLARYNTSLQAPLSAIHEPTAYAARLSR